MTTPETAIQEARAYLAKAAVSLATAALVGEGASDRITTANAALLAAMEALEARK